MHVPAARGARGKPGLAGLPAGRESRPLAGPHQEQQGGRPAQGRPGPLREQLLLRPHPAHAPFRTESAVQGVWSHPARRSHARTDAKMCTYCVNTDYTQTLFDPQTWQPSLPGRVLPIVGRGAGGAGALKKSAPGGGAGRIKNVGQPPRAPLPSLVLPWHALAHWRRFSLDATIVLLSAPQPVAPFSTSRPRTMVALEGFRV
jgi:hypothetical protein